MAEQMGFLDRLGVGSQDEAALMRAQIQPRNPSSAYMLGRAARPGIGMLAGAAQGLITGKDIATGEEGQGRNLRGIGRNMAAGGQRWEDQMAADAAGIDIQQLMGRRAIRKVTAEMGNDGSFEGRERLTRRIAEIASQYGMNDVLGNALKNISDIKAEKVEFEKLQAVKDQSVAAASQAYDKDAWLDGKPVTGVVATDAEGRRGMNIADESGKLQFVPWGERLTSENPLAQKYESVDKRIRTLVTADERKEFGGLLRNSALSLKKFDSVMTAITEMDRLGAAGGVMASAGTFNEWLDNGIQSIKGVANTLIPGAARARDAKPNNRAGASGKETWSGMDWRKRAEDANAALWKNVALPEWARGVSAEATEFRARMMELAYMAARLAEPSNRGLSDNDIKNALTRIAGDSANPQSMMRRFAEIMGDSMYEIDNYVLQLHNRLQPNQAAGETYEYLNDQIDRAMGGKLLPEYRARYNGLLEKHGMVLTPNQGVGGSNVSFLEPLDVNMDAERASVNIQDNPVGSGYKLPDGTQVTLPDQQFLDDLFGGKD